MKLDRNITKPRRGKYALIKLRGIPLPFKLIKPPRDHVHAMVPEYAIDYGDSADTDFFVIRLKDKYAEPALNAYAKAAEKDDAQYAHEIYRLASLAKTHPSKKKPD